MTNIVNISFQVRYSLYTDGLDVAYMEFNSTVPKVSKKAGIV